jgi:rhodanese-related sulfurtransferase
VRDLLQRDAATPVDARTADTFDKGHLPGAINLPAYSTWPEALQVAKTLPQDRPLVVYCSHSTCPASYAAARHLLRAGYSDILIYPGGWQEWEQRTAGPESERSKNEGERMP